MKKLPILLMLVLSACATAPQKMVWQVNPDDPKEMATFQAAYKECLDFGYRSKVIGSRYTEADIVYSCVERKGYTFKME